MKLVRAAGLIAATALLAACAHHPRPVPCGCMPPPEPEPAAVTPQSPPQA
ncbi:MAG: hypothetical protein Q8L23_02125 [Caulobacter sp.]|nr:hypothetical protein [Caulobacter sp.]